MKICILYNVPNTTIKYSRWHDGFTKAISILQNTFNIDMINTFDNPKINFSNYTLVFFKESFNGNIYLKYKSQLVKNNILGLFISSSHIKPDNTTLNIYDILFYLDAAKKLLINYDTTFFKQDALCILKQI